MRKIAIFTLALLLAVQLAACGGGAGGLSGDGSSSLSGVPSSAVSGGESSSVEESSSTGESSSLADSSSLPPDATDSSGQGAEDSFINTELLALLGDTNAAVKARYSGDCFAGGTGLGAALLAVFTPYTEFLFTNGGEGGAWAEDFQTNPYRDDGDIYPENPFVDGLEVLQVRLKAEYDPAANRVTNQDSLRQLLNTDATITYALLAGQLGENPPLEHFENAMYWKPGEGLGLHDRALGEEIPGGHFSAFFDIEGIKTELWFIMDDHTGDYVAYVANIGEVDPEIFIPDV